VSFFAATKVSFSALMDAEYRRAFQRFFTMGGFGQDVSHLLAEE